MQVLNFYSTLFGDQLKRGRKTATIRLGDKSHKYRKNQAVMVTIGYQHSPREKIFDAVIDGGFSTICEKRTTVTVSSSVTSRP